MTFYTVRAVVLCVIPLSFVSTPVVVDSSAQPKQSTDDVQKFDQGQDEKGVVQVHYLEIVTLEVDAAEAAGGEIAMLPTEIPGQGTFAIYILGGIEHGLWEV